MMIKTVLRAAALVAATALATSASAQQWPSKPVTIVSGFTAGSGPDIVLRLVQEPLERELGATFVLEQRGGAAGNIASDFVAKARPDGYTLLLGTSGTHGINAALYRRLAFDVEADFTPITPILNVSNVLAINPQVIDAKTIEEFIAKVKANPGKFNFASTGNGTGTHLAFAEFNARAGLDMVHVAYRGGPEALQAVVTGEACCIFNQVQSVLGQYRAGRVRLLGVTTPTRVEAVPDIPTIDEAGLKGYESFIWFGLFGPKGLDPAIAERINAAMKKVLELPQIRTRLAELGNTPRWESLAQFRDTVRRDRAAWADVVRRSGASVD
ncbi:Bug family tripartite tricarboxylate transporter substrate binding protein [Phreatobacter stygius]|uniref:Tripartite tricarboxylate transporter substrate binding protein n=1 Tax=Phreatobacter stygius TaxID=1940610 RepID=A0A4D7AY01_9HYPH|nr:tripartite tricarboxylate transporter substrate binding protein [Phreatobacter stygius]QCI66414.1 tripartite tricarboxylate transporter substrate binding protein [Phreatobacter stygius]